MDFLFGYTSKEESDRIIKFMPFRTRKHGYNNET